MSALRKLFTLARVGIDLSVMSAWLLLHRPRTRAERAAWLGRACARVMRTIGMTWSVDGPVPQSGAIISNHLTFFDIFLHAASHPCVFVSKAELRSTPLFGWMSMMAGTVYVDRSARHAAVDAGKGMDKGFRDGLPVVFFPEGTTGTDDTTVMPFRSGLLAHVLDTDEPLYAARVHYSLSTQDQAAGKTTQLLYWGKQSLPRLVWDCLGLHQLHGSLTFAPGPIKFSEEALANRKIAAVEAHDAVQSLG